ncbi:MAG: hypothetical protein Kow00104_10250 [Rhodothalassiaceae bacterium]
MTIARLLRSYRRDCSGTTIIEYGLILAVASLIILTVAGILGDTSIDNFRGIQQKVEEANQSNGG